MADGPVSTAATPPPSGDADVPPKPITSKTRSTPSPTPTSTPSVPVTTTTATATAAAAAAPASSSTHAGSSSGSSPGPSSSESSPEFSVAREMLDSLYTTHDTVFTEDKAAKQALLAKQQAGVMAALDDVGAMPGSELAAEDALLRGRALNVLEEYSSEAEIHLARAVKLQPSNPEGWTALGDCFWKKGDLDAARQCFEGSLARRPTADALHNLSMVLRQLPAASPDEKAANTRLSVDTAKEALAMDIKNGRSWYMLGNAYLSMFFGVSHHPDDLRRALTSFERSTENGGDDNPDLFYNKATVLAFLEDYPEAFESYRRAQAIDPALPAAEHIESLARHLQRISMLVTRKGRLKPKKLAALCASLPSDERQRAIEASPGVAGRKFNLIADLNPGRNDGVMVLLKLVLPVRADHPPAVLAMADGRMDCIGVSLYHLDEATCAKLSDKDTFIILDPVAKLIDVKYGELRIKYTTLQVLHPEQFLVNGQSLKHAAAHANLETTVFV